MSWQLEASTDFKKQSMLLPVRGLERHSAGHGEQVIGFGLGHVDHVGAEACYCLASFLQGLRGLYAGFYPAVLESTIFFL